MTDDAPIAKRAPAALQSAIMLHALAVERDGVSVRSAAELVGTSRSAAHRLLQTLAGEGFALQDHQGGYTVGPRLVQLAADVLARSSLLEVANDAMSRLVDEVQETAYLAMLVPGTGHAMFVSRVECSNPVRYVQPIGTRIPLDAGAAGKVILAQLDPIEAASFVGADKLSDMADEIAEIRDRGFATSIEERVAGAAGVAAPVLSRSSVVGALTVNVPTDRLPADGLDSLGPVIASYAEELSTMIVASGNSGF